MKYKLFSYLKSDDPEQGVYIVQDETGWYRVLRLIGQVPPQENIFASIAEIKVILNLDIDEENPVVYREYTEEEILKIAVHKKQDSG